MHHKNKLISGLFLIRMPLLGFAMLVFTPPPALSYISPSAALQACLDWKNLPNNPYKNIAYCIPILSAGNTCADVPTANQEHYLVINRENGYGLVGFAVHCPTYINIGAPSRAS